MLTGKTRVCDRKLTYSPRLFLFLFLLGGVFSK
jgi:hypothetical protein